MIDAWTTPTEAKKHAAPRAPLANIIAEKVLEARRLKADRNGFVYLYNGLYWSEATKHEVRAWAFKTEGVGSTSQRRSEVYDYIQAAALDPHLEWARVADWEVAARNGVVDLLQGKRRAHAPEDNLDRIIPWAWNPALATECPVWLQCLVDWFGEDDSGGELIGALQEFMGYVCLSHAKWKKALVLKGESDTGKSQIVFVLERLVGSEFTCQLSVDLMDDPEKRSVIKGKSLNLMSELSENALVADGGFKTLISTEEPIMLSAKYKPTEMYRPSAKHVIATNNLPRLNDKTAAPFNRLLILPMDRIIPKEKQDRALQDKLLAEMPAIFAWALEGAARLVQRGGVWPEPARSRELLAEYREDQNPIYRFLDECFRREPEGRLVINDLVQSYNDWHGGRKVDSRTLSARLRSAKCEVRKAKVRDGRSLLCLHGWAWLGRATKDELLPEEGGE